MCTTLPAPVPIKATFFFFRASSLFFPLWTLVSWVYNFLFSAALPCFFLPPSPSLPVWTCKLHLAACSLLLLPQLTPILIKLLLPPPPLSVWAFSTHARLLLKMEPLTCIGNGKKNKQKKSPDFVHHLLQVGVRPWSIFKCAATNRCQYNVN